MRVFLKPVHTTRIRSCLSSSGASTATQYKKDQVSISFDSIEAESKEKGRFLIDKPPVYVGPYRNPLDVGADFTQLNKPTGFTSQKQLDHKKDQIRLAKKVVSLLAQMKEIEVQNQKALMEKENVRIKMESAKPRPKGNKLINE